MSEFTPESAREFIIKCVAMGGAEYGLAEVDAMAISRAAFDHVFATLPAQCRNSPGAFVQLVTSKASEMFRDRNAREALFK